MRVLVAEDDGNIRRGIVRVLEQEGYEVLEARDGKEAIEVFRREAIDFVCLDIMMPGMSGYDVCAQIRNVDKEISIVFLSAKSEEIDKVLGLELGADDYIEKPFGVRELVARIRAITRRCLKRRDEGKGEFFCLGEVKVFPSQLKAYKGDKSVDLSLREVKMLSLFSRNRNKVLDRDTLLDECWGMNYLPSSRTLDQHMVNLRKKIEDDPSKPRVLVTVYGVGYKFQAGPEV